MLPIETLPISPIEDKCAPSQGTGNILHDTEFFIFRNAIKQLIEFLLKRWGIDFKDLCSIISF